MSVSKPCQELVAKVQELIKGRPTKMSTFTPRFFGQQLDEVFDGEHICWSVMYTGGKFDTDFVRLCAARKVAEEMAHQLRVSLSAESAAKGEAALAAACRDRISTEKKKEDADRALRTVEGELFDFICSGLAKTSLDTAWNFTLEDMPFSVCPQIAGKICLLKNERTDQYKLGISNRIIGFEMLAAPHTATHGFGRFSPFLAKVLEERPAIWSSFQQQQIKIAGEFAGFFEGLGLHVCWASCNLYPSDFANEEVLAALEATAASFGRPCITAELTEYVDPCMKRSMQALYGIPYSSLDYTQDDLENFTADVLKPAIQRLRQKNVLVAADDILDISFAPFDASGALWNSSVKDTCKSHLTTTSRYLKHSALFDMCKISLADSILATETGGNTLAHENCAGGAIYSAHGGILAREKHPWGEERKASVKKAVEARSVDFTMECTCTEESVVALVGIERTLRHGFIQGEKAMEMKYHPSLTMWENLKALANKPLTDFEEKERLEGWQEVENWQQELLSQPDLVQMLEEQCRTKESARLAEYEISKRRRVQKFQASKGKGKSRKA